MGKQIIPFSDGILIKEVNSGNLIKLPNGYSGDAWEIVHIGVNLKDKDYKIGDHVYMKPGAEFSKMLADNMNKITGGAFNCIVAIVEERHVAFIIRNTENTPVVI